jgi:hypothetical protein
MGLSDAEARARIDRVLSGYQRAQAQPVRSVLPVTVAAGKTYEAWVLCDVLERLHASERFDVRLVNGSKVVLKTGGGPINDDYAHFVLSNATGEVLEVWTDVDFLGLSAAARDVSEATARPCDYHELDIIVVERGVRGRPWHRDIRIAVECKDSAYDKHMLRAILGVRRELSLLTDPMQLTGFGSWPRRTVPADPASCLLVYSSDPSITRFQPPGDTFGIDFVHELMV